MTIRRGEPWGEPGPLLDGAAVFESDRPAARHLASHPALRPGHDGPGPEIGLVGGDLHRTLGSPRHDAEDLRGPDAVRFPVDLGMARTDTGEQPFLAHAVACAARDVRTGGPRWFSARTVAVMNAEFWGDLDLAPRGHPDDGRLDVTDGALPRGDRRRGLRRARSGSHVPHPALSESRVRELELEVPEGGLHLWLDGEHVGRVRSLAVRCLPDAVTVVV